MTETHTASSPEDTFALGEAIARELKAGDVLLLHGGLGAGKTLFTKGILAGLDFDVDEVTSPSFTLVNLYPTEKFDVYHIDLWRIDEGSDAAFAVGLDEIRESGNNVVIIEWAERLGDYPLDGFDITIDGEGDDPRTVTIKPIGNRSLQTASNLK